MKFIERVYKVKEKEEELRFEELLEGKSKISVILGEPGSGKTYQLKNYEKLNENVEFIELITYDQEDIDENVKVILVDSIDEALMDENSIKKMNKTIVDLVKKYRKINPDIRFVITCRFLEWKEIFEESLKEIEENIRIVTIKDLTREDINKILDYKYKDKDKFWKFIEKNYLSMLLKNILMVEYLVEEFEKYEDKKVIYTDLYKDIVEKSITLETDNERNSLGKEIEVEKLIKIGSSIALHMSLKGENYLSTENLASLSHELYKVEEIEITKEMLEILLDTKLFVINGKEFKFFHKSIQEYLTAVFIDENKMNIEKIKKLFATRNKFYERNEEIMIYLTNIESKYFRYLVEFDPFIFRRHPNLTVEEQKLLFVNILKKLKKDQHHLWNHWRSIEETSLVKFDKNIDIVSLIHSKYELEDINREMFIYLEGAVENNECEELEEFLIRKLDLIKEDRIKLDNYLNVSMNKKVRYNKKLLEFINGIDKLDSRTIYKQIFKSLYGKVDFEKIRLLINKFQSHEFQWFTKELSYEDKKKLLLKIMKNADEIREGVCIFLIKEFLRSYNNKNEKLIKRILEFIETKTIYIEARGYEKDLGFSLIREEIYLNYFIEKKELMNLKFQILNFYELTALDIEEAIKKYPIKKYKEKYNSLCRYLKDEEIKKLVSKDELFKEIDEKREKSKRIKEENLNLGLEAEKIEIETFDDCWKLFFSTLENGIGNPEEIKKYIKVKLVGNYSKFVQLIGKEFKKCKLYEEYRDNILGIEVYMKTNLYEHIFIEMKDDEIDEVINSEEEYEKLFWHCLKIDSLSKEFFIKISLKYKPKLKSLILNFYKKSFIEIKEEKKLKNILGNMNFIELLETLKITEIDYLNTLNEITIDGIEENYSKLNDNLKNNLLKVLSKSKENYGVIKRLSELDKEKYQIYFESLAKIDIDKSITDFFNVEKLEIKEKYEKLMSLQIFSSLKEDKYQEISSKNLKWIFENYFKNYDEYEKINNNSNKTSRIGFQMRTIREFLKSDKSKKDLLIEMTDSPIQELQKHSKSWLEEVENSEELKDIKVYYRILSSDLGEKTRFFDYEKLNEDIKEISYKFIESRIDIIKEKEDPINTRYRDALGFKGYTVLDQSQGGESESGKSRGERDLIIVDKETKVSECVLEGFILKGLDATEIKKHYDKLIKKYDTIGNEQNIVLVYFQGDSFERTWGRYKEYFEENYGGFEDIKNDKANLKIGVTKHGEMKVKHYFINFYSE